MNITKRITRLGLGFVALMGLMGLMLTEARGADQQGYASTILSITNMPATVDTNATSTGNNYIALHNNSGLGLQWKFNVNTTGLNSNMVALVYASADGTNFSTSPWYSWTNAANGVTAVVAVKQWSANDLRGLAAFNVKFLNTGQDPGNTNGTGCTLTNQVFLYNRPNN